MIGEQIEKKRIELGLSRRQLAKKSGLTPQYVGLLISGKRGKRVGAEALNGLARALKVKPDFFFQSVTTNGVTTSRKVV